MQCWGNRGDKYCYNDFMKKITVYIDESGTFPDPHDKLIVIAAVGTFSVEKIDIMLKKIKKKRMRFISIWPRPRVMPRSHYFLA